MGSYRVRRIGAAVVGGFVVSLALSGCGAQSGVENAGAVAQSPAATTTIVAPVPAVTTTTAAPAPQETAPAAVAGAPAHKSFTFPDGHISFSYPEDWSVRIQRGPGRDEPPFDPAEAIVSDHAGDDLLRVSSAADGIGCTSGPTHRTVLDKAAVSAMRDAEGTVPEFGFVVESIGGQDWYSMTLRQPRYLQEGETSSGCDILAMGNGASITSVIFNTPPQPAFAGREAARAWMATEQYAQLKALMLSLAYA
jgi:hypothetical protein